MSKVVMVRVVPAEHHRMVIEALAVLQRLQREMSRFSEGNSNYQSQRRALHATIRELRKSLSRKSAPKLD